ncbi:PorT family protein [Gilvimarinus agarilyticus]|nr:PorT family protein [Gilvimarinus agarilyticus]
MKTTKTRAAICIVTLVLTVIGSAAGQNRSNWGISVGSVSNKFTGDDPSSLSEYRFSIYTSYQVGALYEYAISSDVYLTSTPSYKQTGGTLWRENDAFDPNDEDSEKLIKTAKLKLHYLSIPVYFKVISDNTKWQYSVGLVYEYLIHHHGKNIQTQQDIQLSNYIHSYNLSASVSLGYRFHIKQQHFTIDLIYAQGLVNITQDLSQNNNNELPRLKTTSAETRFTWLLPHKNLQP